MINRVLKVRHNRRQAFTLVEIIVVLVILAIIAAVTIPALTGYIKRSRREKYCEEAHYALVACQSVITEYYGTGHVAGNGTVNQAGQTGGGGSGGDIRWDTGAGAKNTAEDVAWGDKVLTLFDRDRSNEPYLLIFGTGRANSGLDESACYSIYYIGYVADENAPAVFYINGEWRYKYPTDSPAAIKKIKNVNYIVSDDGNIPIQYYVVSNKTKIPDNFWTGNNSKTLWGHSEGHFGH
jgi:prepilin-type N-terminal cleavage/methylation domain-containing protein